MFDLGLFWQIIGVLGLLVIVVPWVIRTPPEEYRKAGYREGLDRAWKEAREERNNAIKQQKKKDDELRKNLAEKNEWRREIVKKVLLENDILYHRLENKEGVVVVWNMGAQQGEKYKDFI